jgi:hypothetical protein
MEMGSITLKGGFHKIRVQYFQGPRMHIALVLGVAGPGDGDYRVFNTHEFRPPGNPEDWKYEDPKKMPVADPDFGRRKLTLPKK